MNMKDFKLDNEPKINSGFKIPDNYFDTFSEKVMQQLPNEEVKVIAIGSRNKNWIYTAAAIVVVSLSIPIMNSLQSTTSETNTAEVENYLTYHSTISDDDIVELLETEDINKLNTESPIEDEALEEILTNNSELEHYITN